MASPETGSDHERLRAVASTIAEAFAGVVTDDRVLLRELLTRGALDPNYPTADGVTLLHELCHKDIRGRTVGHRISCRSPWATRFLLSIRSIPRPSTRAPS